MRNPYRPVCIWVTRAQPGADATAARLRERGYEAVVSPVLRTQALAGVTIDLSDVDALAFTSGAAVGAFAALTPRRDLPVFAVGDATAGLARAAGFGRVQSAGGDAAALAKAIAAAPDRPRRVLHPAAAEPAADLVRLLADWGIRARAQTIYRSVATGLHRAPDGVDAVMIHSPKAASLVAGGVGRRRAARMTAWVLSEAVAKPLLAAGFARIIVAPFPDEASLLNLLDD